MRGFRSFEFAAIVSVAILLCFVSSASAEYGPIVFSQCVAPTSLKLATLESDPPVPSLSQPIQLRAIFSGDASALEKSNVRVTVSAGAAQVGSWAFKLKKKMYDLDTKTVTLTVSADGAGLAPFVNYKVDVSILDKSSIQVGCFSTNVKFSP